MRRSASRGSVGCRRGDREGELDQRCSCRSGVCRAQGRHGLADGCRGHQQRRDQSCARHGAEVGPGGAVMATSPSTHTLSVLVQNKPGVLARIAGLISRRGYNIESLAVGPTESPEMSRITLQVNVEDVVLEQITKQLNKLIEVLKIVELEDSAVRRELVLVKVRATAETRSQLIEIIGLFGAKAVDLTSEIITVEATGSPAKLQALLELLEPYGIRELVQSGMVALGRGNRSLTDRNQRTERLKAVPAG